MLRSEPKPLVTDTARRPWDARVARWMVRPLVGTWVRPNHLTTIRLACGIAGAAALARGTHRASLLGALLFVVSNLLDHTDGELARMSGQSSRLGHWYDLASDATVTILLFLAIGVGVDDKVAMPLGLPAPLLGALAGVTVALIFLIRMRLEEQMGKSATRQPAFGGFESEDVLYLLPLIVLLGGLVPFLLAAALGAPLFATWVVIEYRRLVRRRAVAVHLTS